MSMHDPIADMLTRIRNGLYVRKTNVLIPFSNQKQSISKILLTEGYINNFKKIKSNGSNISFLQIKLKYYNNKPVIETLKRVSRPGLRIYRSFSSLPKINSGLGIAIISTSKGLMSDASARKQGIGGEVICYVI